MAALYEKMIRVQHGELAVRCWVKGEAATLDADMSGLRNDLKAACARIEGTPKPGELAAYLLREFPDLNAVEVIGANGCGEIIHREWP